MNLLAGIETGRVIRVDKESGLVSLEESEVPVMVKTDAVRWKGKPLAVGDYVKVQKISDEEYTLQELLPRKTALFRKDPGKQSKEQVIAANMDLVVLVQGLDQKLNIAKLERGLVLISESGAAAEIVLSKADLAEPEHIENYLEEIATLQTNSPVVTSSISEQGIAELEKLLEPQKTMVLLGSSGAGKSSLINALIKENSRKTVEVRKTDARGRHATVARELIVLPKGGSIIDTPGLRAIGLADIDSGLEEAFSEISKVAKDCKFRDCAHINEPDCAVKAAVESGGLLAERLKRYLHLKEEATQMAKDKEENERKKK